MSHTPMRNLRRWVPALSGLLPAPAREKRGPGGVTLKGGQHEDIVVRITPEALTVTLFDVAWDGPATPIILDEPLVVLPWDRCPQQFQRCLPIVVSLVRGVCELRNATYRRCRMCGETNPPGWMHNATVCQGCAERHLGVVY